MKRLALGAVACVLVLAGFMAIGQPWQSTNAQDQRTIPVFFGSDLQSTDYEEGESCGASLDLFRFVQTDYQVVIRNENNTVIAIQTLRGLAEPTLDDNFQCKGNFNIIVPESEFYTVYLGEERVVAFSASQFPLDPLDGVLISINE